MRHCWADEVRAGIQGRLRASTLLVLQLERRVLMLPLWLLPRWLQLVLLPLLLVWLLQVLLLWRRRLADALIGSNRMASDAISFRLEPMLAISSRLRISSNSNNNSLTSSNCNVMRARLAAVSARLRCVQKPASSCDS